MHNLFQSNADRSSPGELIAAEFQFRCDDERTTSRERADRDHRLAQRLQASSKTKAQLVRGWLYGLPSGGGGSSPGLIAERIDGCLRLVFWVTVLIGAGLGIGVVAAIVGEAGDQPVNVITFLAGTVGVQFILLMLAAIAWLSLRSRSGRSIGPHPFAAMLGSIVDRGLAKTVATLGLRDLHDEDGRGTRRIWNGHERLLRLWLLRAFQASGAALNLAAVITLLVLVVISDPAFGWRSRELDAVHVHRLASNISAPWRWGHHAGVPSREEVERTQFSRLEQERTPTGPEPTHADWGAWWPFLAWAIVVYGLTPRLIMYILVTRGQRSVANDSIEQGHFNDLMDRLRHDPVDTRAVTAETAKPQRAATVRRSSEPTYPSQAWRVIRWGGRQFDDTSVLTLLESSVAGHVAEIVDAGELDVAHDAIALDAVARAGGPVAVVIPAWETPARDHLDFLLDLRRRVGPDCTVRLLFYGELDRSQTPDPDALYRLWRDTTGELEDPRVYIGPQPGAGHDT